MSIFSYRFKPSFLCLATLYQKICTKASEQCYNVLDTNPRVRFDFQA